LVVDLEWNRKTIFEKLDWLKDALEDIIAKANHNIDVQQKQILAITARLTALEKPARKAAPARKSASVRKSKAAKKPARAPSHRTKQSPPSKRKR
jgi:hypothetical protein